MTAVVCAICGFDRAPLPSGARFCPRCGGALSEDAATIAAAIDSFTDGNPALPPTLPALAMVQSRSPILLGFANALYRLGWRYETGVGAWRNEAEAHRCYGKSAKLGNVAAAARLQDAHPLSSARPS